MTAIAKSIVWANGRSDQTLDATDRGLAYGDGLFETMRFEHGAVALLEWHLQRLRAGCEALAIHGVEALLGPVLERLDMEMRALPRNEQENPFTVKLIVTRGCGGQGYTPLASPSPPTVVMRITPLHSDDVNARQGVCLHLCRWRLALIPLLAGIKHLNRLEYVMAAQELVEQQITAQGLLTDANGCVTESLHHNVFVVKRGELLTPRIGMCGVRGIMRAFIIERLAPAIGLTVSEQELRIDDLIGAQEVFLCNSVHGIWPVREFRGTAWQPGPITRQLQEPLIELWQGQYAG